MLRITNNGDEIFEKKSIYFARVPDWLRASTKYGFIQGILLHRQIQKRAIVAIPNNVIDQAAQPTL
ncbi:hypothetical protein AXX02_06425 [Pseudomonas aeruginosa]|nr:hypothetical protein AXX02_06425 [Pseudomonas aeruginosa]